MAGTDNIRGPMLLLYLVSIGLSSKLFCLICVISIVLTFLQVYFNVVEDTLSRQFSVPTTHRDRLLSLFYYLSLSNNYFP